MTQRAMAVSACLTDAGCDDEMIAQFLLYLAEGKITEGFCLLSKQRRQLLDAIHQDQKRLDTLDHLIYLMKKEQPK